MLSGENIPGLSGFGPVQRTLPASTPASTARQLSEDDASRTSSWWGACGRGGRAVGAIEHQVDPHDLIAGRLEQLAERSR